jgi:hypothetical protein
MAKSPTTAAGLIASEEALIAAFVAEDQRVAQRQTATQQ